jgi:hypothetical protein
MNVKVISAILVLALASLACGVTIDLPEQSQVGADVTDSVTVADPKVEETRVSLVFGAGQLSLAPGATDLVNGTAVYNVRDLKPDVNVDGGEVQIRQGEFQNLPPLSGMKNRWDLQLGKAEMDLEISAGAYDGTFDLGGLALRNLTIQDGASDVVLSFSEPNKAEMAQFRYSTGASDVTMTGLANANFKTMVFNSGAGDYRLDFSGELQRDATVSIDSGLSDLTLIIPEGVNAVVTIDSALADINVADGWSQKGKVYTQTGAGPTLTIVINMGAGNIKIQN